MAKIEDIVRQLQAVLPLYTDYFNDSLAISTITNPAGSTYQITTSSAHNLTTDDYINIENVLAKNQITTVTDLGDDKIKLKTTVSHDMTEGFNLVTGENYPKKVYLFDFTNLADGFYDLLEVPSKDEFIVDLSVVPTGTGFVCENRLDSINGRFQVTVIDSTNFTIDVLNSNFNDFIIFNDTFVKSNIRISGVGNPSRFIEYYSKQQNLTDFWAYVSVGETSVSFDRQITSDANQRVKNADDLRWECDQSFFVYVIAPTTDLYGGRFIRDLMVDIRRDLCKALCGVKFPSGFDTEQEGFLTTFLSDDFFDYVGSYYVHEFQFQNVYNFNPNDGVDPLNTRAFREFEINFKLMFDDYGDIKKTIEGDLP